MAVGPSVTHAASSGSLFIQNTQDDTGKKVDFIKEPTYIATVPAPKGYEQPSMKDAKDPSKRPQLVEEGSLDFEDLTDDEQAKIIRVNQQNPILRNVAAVVAFFSVLGAGITLVNYRMELK